MQFFENRGGLFPHAVQHEPARAFRQKQDTKKHHQRGQRDHAEHEAPGFIARSHCKNKRLEIHRIEVARAVVRLRNRNLTVRQSGKKGVAQKRHQNSDGDHQLIHRNHSATDGLRSDFRQIKRSRKRGDAHRKAEHHARDNEHVGVRCHRAENRPGGEEKAAGEKRPAATEFVAKNAAAERADHRAPEKRAYDPLDHLVVHTKIALDVNLRSGDHAHIEAEKKTGQRGSETNEINDRADFFGGRGGAHKEGWFVLILPSLPKFAISPLSFSN